MQLRALSSLVPDPTAFVSAPPDAPVVWEMPAEPLTRLLTLADVDRVVGQNLSSDKLRVVSDGVTAPVSSYLSRAGGAGRSNARSAGSVSPSRVGRLLAKGSTLVLDGLQHVWEPTAELCRRLSFESGCSPVDASAFLTPAGGRGFGYHWDIESVLLVQTSGSKTWHLHTPVRPLPLAHEWEALSDADQERCRTRQPDLAVDLRPGQVLWIPRGWIHGGHTTDRPSLHVSFGFLPFTRYWLAMRVIQAMDERRPEFDTLRHRLPMGIGGRPQELRLAVADVAAALAAALPHVDTDAVAADAALGMRGDLPDAPMHAASLLSATVTADTRVRLVPEHITGLDARPDGRFTLSVGTVAITVGEKAGRWLADRREQATDQPWCAADMAPATDDGAAIRLVGELLTSGAARVAP
ncbi:JmjC domain-containing protein [Streptomyces sp. NBC_01190]|uniref:JmjC domain-containing protein n=1 Tax=Streptomyces sp. NBC_01190 TaxID=2903767 RepID=UPI003870613A|nr:cupin domain-containing protein [Streptomyces sp. NBC_01190]